MARFVYRMQSILNLKLKTEDQVRMELGVAQHNYNEAEEELNALFARRESYLQDARNLQSNILSVREIMDTGQYVKIMDEEIALQKSKVQSLEEILEQTREKMTVAVQERKMQERLRERAFEQYMAEERAAEAIESDQRTSFTYGQKTRDNSN